MKTAADSRPTSARTGWMYFNNISQPGSADSALMPATYHFSNRTKWPTRPMSALKTDRYPPKSDFLFIFPPLLRLMMKDDMILTWGWGLRGPIDAGNAPKPSDLWLGSRTANVAGGAALVVGGVVVRCHGDDRTIGDVEITAVEKVGRVLPFGNLDIAADV